MKRQPRQVKTPRQRAEEQLGVAERAVKRLTEKFDALKAEAEEVGADLLGSFDSAEEAALAYDSEAIRRWGEFARPNFPQEMRNGDRS